MNEGPTFCWLCGGGLEHRSGGYYKAMRLIDGHNRTLHIGCAERHDQTLPTPHIFPDNPHDEYVKGEGNH